MFTGDNILGQGSSAIEDLSTFMKSLQVMLDQECKIGYPGHGAVLPNLGFKVKAELATKLRREKQTLQALSRIRSQGEKSATLSTIVTEIYGKTLDEQTRTLALEPFIDEVLRKLAVDGKVAFERKSGLKKWYSVEQFALFRAKTMPLVQATTMSTLSI